MAKHGSLSEFHPGEEDWLEYVERFVFYCEANSVKDDSKRRAILLSSIGAVTYKIVRNLISPRSTSDVTYEEIVQLLQDHLDPKPSVIVQRFKFYSTSRNESESITSFIARLRKIAEHCDFKDTLEEMLRDRLVCGVKNDRIQRRLLSEKNLTFKSA